ncbi:MAG: hypothetical protein ACLTGJ_07120 [Faecalibacterium prausnitzii]
MLPSAAIFVVFCLLVWWRGGAARGYAVCLLLGAVLGVGIMKTTGARLAKIQDAYAGKKWPSPPEVESIGPRLYGGPGERRADGGDGGRESCPFPGGVRQPAQM